MSLGAKIQQLRKTNGMSQEQLGEVVGVSRQAVSKWESDQAAPEIEKIQLICKRFTVTMDDLLGAPKPEPEPDRPAEPPALAPAEPEKTSEKAERAPVQSEAGIKANMAKHRFTVGWVTVLVGTILMLVEYFSLFVVQFLDYRVSSEAGYRWYQNALRYADIPPMPLIFGVTRIMIAVGVLMAINGALGMRLPKKTSSL